MIMDEYEVKAVYDKMFRNHSALEEEWARRIWDEDTYVGIGAWMQETGNIDIMEAEDEDELATMMFSLIDYLEQGRSEEELKEWLVGRLEVALDDDDDEIDANKEDMWAAFKWWSDYNEKGYYFDMPFVQAAELIAEFGDACEGRSVQDLIDFTGEDMTEPVVGITVEELLEMRAKWMGDDPDLEDEGELPYIPAEDILDLIDTHGSHVPSDDLLDLIDRHRDR